MNKTDHQLAMLAGATREGKPVHPELAKYAAKIAALQTMLEHVWLPVFNLMAMIEACQAQEWRPTFLEPGMVSLLLAKSLARINAHETTNEAALTDAVFQATEALADNWVDCPGRGNTLSGLEGHDEKCCHGTGKLMEEVQDE